jgi:hypothetical protein
MYAKNLLNARSPSHFDGSSDSFNDRIGASHQNQSVKLKKKTSWPLKHVIFCFNDKGLGIMMHCSEKKVLLIDLN